MGQCGVNVLKQGTGNNSIVVPRWLSWFDPTSSRHAYDDDEEEEEEGRVNHGAAASVVCGRFHTVR